MADMICEQPLNDTDDGLTMRTMMTLHDDEHYKLDDDANNDTDYGRYSEDHDDDYDGHTDENDDDNDDGHNHEDNDYLRSSG